MGTKHSKGGVSKHDKKENPLIPAEVKEITIILIGAGESGKSTIQKQIKITYLGVTENECLIYKDKIHYVAATAIKNLINASVKLGAKMKEENLEFAQFLMQMDIGIAGEMQWTATHTEAVKAVWSDPAIKKVLNHRGEYQLDDGAAYYLDDIERISAENYVPTEQDVVRCRIKTVGVPEVHFQAGELSVHLLDVGGQRTERRKWYNKFPEADAVIFVASLAEFDQVLYEDGKTNRMQESILLFAEVCNSSIVSSKPLFLFFNKKDLLEQRLPHFRQHFGSEFEQFRSASQEKQLGEFEQASQFLISKYTQHYQGETPLKIYQTTAIDSAQLKHIFEEMRTGIVHHKQQIG